MAILVALVIGLMFWIAAYSLGVKSVLAFCVTVLLVLLATGYKLAEPYIRRLRGQA